MQFRKYLLILTVCLSNQLFAQTYLLKYEVTKNIKGRQITVPFAYFLETDGEKSVFYPSIEDEKEFFKYTFEESKAIYTGAGAAPIYYDIKSKKLDFLVHKIKADGMVLLTNRPIMTWEITNETKQIGTFTCYKAIGTSTELFGNSTKYIVWFTPTPNLNVGPKYLQGLPGMVVTAEDEGKDLTFKLLSVEATNKITHSLEPDGSIPQQDATEFFEMVAKLRRRK
jgi:GLPGLI family protein